MPAARRGGPSPPTPGAATAGATAEPGGVVPAADCGAGTPCSCGGGVRPLGSHGAGCGAGAASGPGLEPGGSSGGRSRAGVPPVHTGAMAVAAAGGGAAGAAEGVGSRCGFVKLKLACTMRGAPLAPEAPGTLAWGWPGAGIGAQAGAGAGAGGGTLLVTSGGALPWSPAHAGAPMTPNLGSAAGKGELDLAAGRRPAAPPKAEGSSCSCPSPGAPPALASAGHPSPVW